MPGLWRVLISLETLQRIFRAYSNVRKLGFFWQETPHFPFIIPSQDMLF